jgi:D-tagatose-1,6-bisphosphate aldolase subunit GatZ/KbaZ
MSSKSLGEIVRKVIDLNASGRPLTLLAVCPNSEAVLRAAVRTARDANAPLLLAATLNQVDRDGGYTGWSPAQFVNEVNQICQETDWNGPVYPCLDHGGPWLKDAHTRDHLSQVESLSEVKQSISACLQAGYRLLHIDPTVDRTLPAGQTPSVAVLLERTVEMIAHSEQERKRLHLPPIDYEVGSEEVHGGLVDQKVFKEYLSGLRKSLASAGLASTWPCFIVAQVGTDLHTTSFDRKVAHDLYRLVAPLGSLIKGHYTDGVRNPHDYPLSGMGAANVGPEFTAVEFQALKELEQEERRISRAEKGRPCSEFTTTLTRAVVASERWRKWLLPGEQGMEFGELSPARQHWLAQTGARYIWTDPSVQEARQRLFLNLGRKVQDPGEVVIQTISARMQRYFEAFNLIDSLEIL